ncbi:MAG: sugar phosphate isomerase/epimerase [Clostridia bacterium]|nr:sugar phosphate isomerase/epimerase [Clostridia bacterium]
MKYTVTCYSFTQYVKAGKLTWKDCIAKAKELGFDAIEFTNSPFENAEDPLAVAKELRAEADRLGMVVSNLAVGADLLAEDGVEKVCRYVDIAEILGAPTLRHDVAKGFKNPTFKGYDSVLPQLADACRKITEYAAQKGIRTMTENHGFFSQDSLRVEKLINTVAHENFGQLVDLGNFMCADEDPVTAVGRCAPYAFYVHAKDFILKSGQEPDPGEGFFATRGGNFLRGTIIGHGVVPVTQCLRALKKAGYDGWLSVEFEGMEDCLKGIGISLANLKKYAE